MLANNLRQMPRIEKSKSKLKNMENLSKCSRKSPRWSEQICENNNVVGMKVIEDEEAINYYPKCDSTIWLRTCEQEVIHPISPFEVNGIIPKWIKGSLLRNGPGMIQVGEDSFKHLFDAASLLHRFNIENGRVTYQNRYLKSQTYLKNKKANRIVVSEFGTKASPDPCRSIFKTIASVFVPFELHTDNAMISIIKYGDEFYAQTETPFVHRINSESLETLDTVLTNTYAPVVSHTAHPQRDSDGTVYNLGQTVGLGGINYGIVRYPPSFEGAEVNYPLKNAKVIASLSPRWKMHPSYMHSFVMTPNYFVLIEQPLTISLTRVVKTALQGNALIEGLKWFDEETKFIIFNRQTGKTVERKYFAPCFFFLHTVNGYEQDGFIVFDVCLYKDARMIDCMYIESLKNARYNPDYADIFRGRPKRFVVPLNVEKSAGIGVNLVTLENTDCVSYLREDGSVYCMPELLSDVGCEVPTYNEHRFHGKPYRYFYAIGSDVDAEYPGQVIKVDTVRKTFIRWAEDDAYPSEPIFVESPNPVSEDDGVLLTVVLRAKGSSKNVDLVIIDAKSMKEIGRAKFESPSSVPKCLHGTFFDQRSI